MASELNVLAHMLEPDRREQSPVARLHAQQPARRASSRSSPASRSYRTYVTRAGLDARRPRGGRAGDRPRAAAQSGDGRRRIFDFLPRGDAAARPRRCRRHPARERRDGYPPADATEAAERLRFAMKFQQYTGPLQAKGLEDTAFYRYNVLLSLNEVGGDPSRFGCSVGGVPRAEPAAAAGLAVRDARDRPRTTPSSARTCARASTCCRRCPTNGAARWRAGCGSTRASAPSSTASRPPTATTSTASTRRSSACGRSSRRRRAAPPKSSSGFRRT